MRVDPAAEEVRAISPIFIAGPAFALIGRDPRDFQAGLADRPRPALPGTLDPASITLFNADAIDPTPSMIAQKVNLANTANKPGCACHRLLTIFAASGRTALSRRTSPKLEASGTIPARPNDSSAKAEFERNPRPHAT